MGKVVGRRVRGDLRRHVGLSRADRSDSLCHLTLITDTAPSILTLHPLGPLTLKVRGQSKNGFLIYIHHMSQLMGIYFLFIQVFYTSKNNLSLLINL